MFRKQIYLDHAATTYLDSRVVKAMEPYWQKQFGNPSSLYALGQQAKQAVESARQKIAAVLNCRASEIIFEGSGTESINHALIGVALANRARGNHLITSVIEHHAVLHSFEYLESIGFEVTYLPVDKEGIVRLDLLKSSFRTETILVSVMYANNEIGTIQPIKEISQAVKKENNKILFHTDACQAAGYLDLDVAALGVDLMSVNGSKIYGPKGTGFLYVKEGTAISPIIHGGEQENSQRAGTENVPGIVGMSKALELVSQNKEAEVKRLTVLRDKLIDGLLKIPQITLNGGLKNRLPNNVNVIIEGIKGEQVVASLDKLGIACSTGSACTSGKTEPSHVIVALGGPFKNVASALRFSLGHNNNIKDINRLLAVLPKVLQKLRHID